MIKLMPICYHFFALTEGQVTMPLTRLFVNVPLNSQQKFGLRWNYITYGKEWAQLGDIYSGV